MTVVSGNWHGGWVCWTGSETVVSVRVSAVGSFAVAGGRRLDRVTRRQRARRSGRRTGRPDRRRRARHPGSGTVPFVRLLSPTDVRGLLSAHDLRPSRALG